MIPLHLTLKNFFSYQAASLNFQGLHTACICGANGAGKSSLLEAMTWAIWGKSRAGSEDDLIHTGAQEVRVDFTFSIGGETYRVIRSRPRGRSGELQFQIQSQPSQFRTLNAKGIRATQDLIITTIKLDYRTFVNSAYLRQGRADEFMLVPANERKKVLAELLKLEEYDRLAERAKDAAKGFKAQQDLLNSQQEPRAARLAEQQTLTVQRDALAQQLQQLQRAQGADQRQLEALKRENHERDRLTEQEQWQQNRLASLDRDQERRRQTQAKVLKTLGELNRLVENREAIGANYQQLQQWQREDVELTNRATADHAARAQRQEVINALNAARNQIHLNQRTTETELNRARQECQDLVPMLAEAPNIEERCRELAQCRRQLQDLDQRQQQVTPWANRAQQLRLEIAQVRSRYSAQRDQLAREKRELTAKKQTGPALRQELFAKEEVLENLKRKETYRARLESKLSAQTLRQTELAAQQQALKNTLADLEQKWQFLQAEGANCPLCDRPLGESDRAHVLTKNRTAQTAQQEDLWHIQTEITDAQRQQGDLKRELAALAQELEQRDRQQQEVNKLEHQLERLGEISERIWEIDHELEHLDQALHAGQYAEDLQQELMTLTDQISALQYDDKTHSLLRSQERKLSWAETKASRLEDARKRQSILNEQIPQLQARLTAFQQELTALEQTSELAQQLQTLNQTLATLGYDPDAHQKLRHQLRNHSQWELDYQRLTTAEQQKPEIEAELSQINAQLATGEQERAAVLDAIKTLQATMATLPDYRAQIAELTTTLDHRQAQLAQYQRDAGAIEAQIDHLTQLAAEYAETEAQINQLKQQHRIYNELAKAFGKNGIQALMIENVLPQLEAETNYTLSRLTGNQLHVQFLTQKAGKQAKAKQAPKMIDTLDILIADAQGTRPYETYSGGEAFRINFSIRLALAKLLAQRSGAALQMLIIDEGFGTQDGEGCDRLVAAINAIASDFACILAVTHMPQFKEAFQHRIEVQKTNQGSHLVLSS
ncbi:exonuclease subunit SbcC [Spirulina sp. CCNP1310]|uniref:exonuclease subunit SbcC n=1 Tax=Spirulina sp. CCNP1310 TaxID=3110249 RepID=UPI002B2045A9|nr:exonuclease subunit SbcC [Spirulina sp. CCNP1310]MEA5419794.1 exonuclease subunit SbcC [Spirulina sp. CCNP1310]